MDMANIYDTANQLERELRLTDAYSEFEAAYGVVKNDSEANSMFQDFQNLQISLQQKQMAGEEISESEIVEAQEMAKKTGDNEIIQGLMEAEKKLSILIEDLNRIIMKPVQDVYQG